MKESEKKERNEGGMKGRKEHQEYGQITITTRKYNREVLFVESLNCVGDSMRHLREVFT